MISRRFGLRRFIGLARPNFFEFSLSITLLIVSTLLEGVSVGLIIPLLDVLMKGGDVASAFQLPVVGRLIAHFPSDRLRYFMGALLGGILLAVVLKNFFVYQRELLMSRLSRACEHRLRTQVYTRYLSFGKKFFDTHKIGSIVDLALTQVFTACGFFRDLHNLLLYGLMAAVYFSIMLVISWKLTLIALGLLPWMYFLTRAISQRIVRSTNEKFEIDQSINARIFDTLANMSLIRSYTNEAREAEAYERLSDRSRANLFSIWRKLLLAPYLQEVVLNIVIAALVAISFFVFLKTQAMPVALFLSFFIVLRRFAGNLSQGGATYNEFSKTFVPIREVVAVFDDADKEFIRGGDRPFTGLKQRIEFKKVSFAYKDTAILNGLDLVFEKGRMTAIVGPTGAGKTTLVNLLPRFYDPTAGDILIDGTPVREFDLRSLRRRIAVVDQEVSTFNVSIRENIVYGIEETVPQERLDEAAKKAFIYDLIQSLPQKYETQVGDRGVRLSGGEKQRVAIARALLKDPDIFIFDEATSSLDVETERQIQMAIENVTRGRTVVAIAHRLSTIKSADTIYVIEKGSVTEEGRFRDLIEKKGGRFNYYWNLHLSEPGGHAI